MALSILAVGLIACTIPNPAFLAAAPGDAGSTKPDLAGDAPAAPAVDAPKADGSSDLPMTDAAQESIARNDAAPVFDSAMTLGAWPFDEGAGSSTAADVSGDGANGTLVDLDPQQAWVAGRKGGAALRIVPSSGKPAPGVRIDAPRLKALKRFTIAAWVLRASTTSTQVSVISQQLTGNDEVFNLCAINDALNLYLPITTDGIEHRVRSSKNIPIGTWTHVAATFDGTTAHLYFNGTDVASLTYPRALPTLTAPVYIGININATNSQPFFGDIDDVAIFDNALSPAEIAQLAKP